MYEWLPNLIFITRETHSSRGRRFPHFLLLAGRKCDLCRVVKATYQRDLGSCVPIFCILTSWKRDMYRVVKPTFHRSPCSCEHIFCIFAVLECDLCRHETHISRWPMLLCALFCTFAVLKHYLCRVVKHRVHWDPASWVLIFYIMVVLNAPCVCSRNP